MGSGTKINGLPINQEVNKSTTNSTIISYDKEGNKKIVDNTQKIILDPMTKLQLELDEKEKFRKQELYISDQRGKIETYNNTLLETANPKTKEMELLGPRVMIRLFKLQRYNIAGVYIGGRTIEVMSKSELNKQIVEAPDDVQFQERGTVINISSDCSEAFRNKVKIGDTVDLDPNTNINKLQRFIEKETIDEKFDNYFLIHEGAVEAVFKQNKN